MGGKGEIGRVDGDEDGCRWYLEEKSKQGGGAPSSSWGALGDSLFAGAVQVMHSTHERKIKGGRPNEAIKLQGNRQILGNE